MLVNQKTNKRKKLHPTRIYLVNLYTYNQIKIKSSSQILGKWKAGCLGIAIQGPLSQTRMQILVPLSVGSTRKILLTYSAYKNLKRWYYASPTTVGTDTTFSTPKMGRSNSTIMKWVYYTSTPKKSRT